MGEVYEQYIFIPGEYTVDQKDGWFFFDDGYGTYHKETRSFAFGEGCVINTPDGEEDNAFTFSGEVSQESTPIEISLDYNWLGNCTPVAKTLADLAVDGDTFISTTVEFFNSNGGVNVINDDDMGEVYEQYIFIPGEYTVDQKDGWFFFDDGYGTYHKESRIIPAGAGFVVNCPDGEEGNVIDLPSAL